MPDTVAVAGKTLILNGLGIRQATVFKVDVYVAGLYLSQRSSDPAAILRANEPKRIHLVPVRDVDRGQIVEAMKEGFEKNVPAQVAGLRAKIEQFTAWLPDFRKGTSATLTYLPSRGVEVAVNGVVKGTIEGSDFSAALFSLWIGPNPPNASLKQGLLGGKR
jgi:hypothetical protein